MLASALMSSSHITWLTHHGQYSGAMVVNVASDVGAECGATTKVGATGAVDTGAGGSAVEATEGVAEDVVTVVAGATAGTITTDVADQGHAHNEGADGVDRLPQGRIPTRSLDQGQDLDHHETSKIDTTQMTTSTE